MRYMSKLGHIYYAVKRIRGAKGESIHDLSTDDLETWDKLAAMGVMD